MINQWGGVKFSTTEQIVGEWIDGKPLYSKVISFGQLPSSSSIKQINVSDLHIKWMPFAIGTTYDSGTNTLKLIPYSHSSGVNNNIFIDLRDSKTKLTIGVGSNQSNCKETYVIILYTKTTD